MARITIKRTDFTEAATFGRLFIDGVEFCDTLEPIDRAIEDGGAKIKGTTAIPNGEYRFSLWESPRFRCTTLRLHDVPQFADILVHPGNYAKDTQGCILVGRRNGKMLINSRTTLERLLLLVRGSHDINRITITR